MAAEIKTKYGPRPKTEPDHEILLKDGKVEVLSVFRVDPKHSGRCVMDLPPEGLDDLAAEWIKAQFPTCISGWGEVWLQGKRARIHFYPDDESNSTEANGS